jgi:hypothetical protein
MSKKLQPKVGDLVIVKYNKVDLEVGWGRSNPFALFRVVRVDGTLVALDYGKGVHYWFGVSRIVAILKDKENEKKKATA